MTIRGTQKPKLTKVPKTSHFGPTVSWVVDLGDKTIGKLNYQGSSHGYWTAWLYTDNNLKGGKPVPVLSKAIRHASKDQALADLVTVSEWSPEEWAAHESEKKNGEDAHLMRESVRNMDDLIRRYEKRIERIGSEERRQKLAGTLKSLTGLRSFLAAEFTVAGEEI